MKNAALGFRAHSGWTAAVTVSMHGSDSSPTVLDRRRIHLVETFTYAYRQPYHTAEKMPLADATKFIANARGEAGRLALAAIRGLQKDLEKLGWRLSACGLLLASGRALPELEQILASHALIHTADGELFREALRGACARCDLPVVSLKERELFDSASKTLSVKPDALKRRIAALGKSLGPPWSQDEKFSALAAWVSLAS
jgi:hypothetical protein